MTEKSRPDIPPKLDPEDLQLRAPPRRVVRFRRGVIVGVAALGSGAILGVTMMALQGPALRIKEQAEELYDTERKPTADGLEALPADYSGIKPDTPVLGPPLPGDLGRPILERQRQLGIAPGQDVSAEEQRLAQQAVQARESEVFFRIEKRAREKDAAGDKRDARPQLEATLKQPDTGQARAPVAPAEGDQNNQQRKAA
jgi:type IV secretory pathway VirB10-like protein